MLDSCNPKVGVCVWVVFCFLFTVFQTGCSPGTPLQTPTTPAKTFTADDVSIPLESSPTSLEPSPGETSPTVTKSYQPTITNTPVAHTATHTPAPTLTSTPIPTTTPTPIPIPSLERVLYLESPELQGDDVLKLQTWLRTLGYDEVGAPDGVFGAKTDQAVRLFQGDQGLEVDGYVGEATWTRLFFTSEVNRVEARLKDLGYGVCESNKIYSEQTTSALAKFQQMNDLQDDGVLGNDTWSSLFSGDAAPLSVGPTLPVSGLGEVGMAGHLSFDGGTLWLAGSESLLQIDPLLGEVVNTFPIPDLGQVSDSFGVTYPKTFSADEALIFNENLWVSGEVISYPNLQASAVLVFDFLGELIRNPVFLSSNRDSLTWVPGLLAYNGKVLAALDAYPSQTILELNPLSYQVGRSVPLRGVEAVYDLASDGETIWISMVLNGDRTVRSLNLNTGRFGSPLIVCGYELVFDGSWLWVERSARVYAVDPGLGEVVAHTRVDGTIHSLASDRQGTLWVLVNKSSKWHLQRIDAR